MEKNYINNMDRNPYIVVGIQGRNVQLMYISERSTLA